MVCSPYLGVGNHLLSFPGLFWSVRTSGAVRGRLQRAARLVLLVAKHSELAFPGYLPGRFAGGSNLLSQGGRGMGAAHKKGVLLVGRGESPVTDHTQRKKKILQPFSSVFYFCLLA